MPETEKTTTTNGNAGKPAPASPFQIERSLMGVANAFIQVAEDVVCGKLGVNEAVAATKALNGVPAVVKTQLEVLRIFETGSEKARQQALRILDLGAPEPKALPET